MSDLEKEELELANTLKRIIAEAELLNGPMPDRIQIVPTPNFRAMQKKFDKLEPTRKPRLR